MCHIFEIVNFILAALPKFDLLKTYASASKIAVVFLSYNFSSPVKRG